MGIHISQFIATVINFAILISIVIVFVKVARTVLNTTKSNRRIEEKLDRVIEMLEKRE